MQRDESVKREENMKKILFVCSGNTCRSPMAEGIFNSEAAEKNLDFIAQSAGVGAISGAPYSTNAVLACMEIGIDISKGRSKNLRDLNVNDYCLFVPMTCGHARALAAQGIDRDKIILLKSDGISDPYGGNLQMYRDCRDEIKQAVKMLIEKL